MKKGIVFGAIAVLVIVIAILVSYLLSNLNSLVAKAIEKHGSEVTETTVGVSGVDISLREGRGSIDGLSVASPSGFKARQAFDLGEISVDLDLGSVRKDPVVLDAVRIQAPVVNVEFDKEGNSNIDELRKRVQAYSGASKENGGGGEKRIRIKSFVFEKGSITVDATALGMEKKTLSLPEIHMTDVGGTDGSTAAGITKEVLSTVVKSVTSELAHSEINHLIEDKLGDSLPDKAKSLLKKLGSGDK